MTDVLKKPNDMANLTLNSKKKEVTLDLTKKHPLESSWTFWFDNPNGKQKQTTWGQTLRSVYTFKTIEDFWCLYNNVVPPSRLVTGADLHVFKEGIEPKWEDPQCATGGEWRAQVPKGDKKSLDSFWLSTLLALIGEQFKDGDSICGVVVSVRKSQDRVCLWTKNAPNEAVQLSIGTTFKQTLELPGSARLGFTTFDEQAKSGRKAREKYGC
jgi:translation initiation factor 4E